LNVPIHENPTTWIGGYAADADVTKETARTASPMVAKRFIRQS